MKNLVLFFAVFMALNVSAATITSSNESVTYGQDLNIICDKSVSGDPTPGQGNLVADQNNETPAGVPASSDVNDG